MAPFDKKHSLKEKKNNSSNLCALMQSEMENGDNYPNNSLLLELPGPIMKNLWVVYDMLWKQEHEYMWNA